jgi:very-short-patch-repair endonuclease
MRREMTRAEFRLWHYLRKPGIEGLRFRRQAPVGPYIVDFFCPERQLVVEVDGDRHGLAEGERRDADRDAWLSAQGYRVVRVGNRDVLTNIDGVCRAITAAVFGPG